MTRARWSVAVAGVAVIAALGACVPGGGGGGGGGGTPTTTTTIPPFTVPAGSHGELLTRTPVSIAVGNGAPTVTATRISYRSTDSRGAANVVTGTVLVPTTAWTAGLRPLVAYAPGTHGLALGCAPSAQLAAGTDYEASNIAAALARNWAVVVPDYAGYRPGETPTYLAGRSEGHAVLDAIIASFQVTGAGISPTTKTAVWGYSQGGQAAAWAGELEPTYAAAINLAGVAAGGVPGNFRSSAASLNGSTGAAFLASAVVGLTAEYPDQIPLASLANPVGQAAIADLKTKCVFEAINDYRNVDIKDYTVGALTLDQLLAIPSIGGVIDAQNLGTTGIAVPLYQYHGQADEFLPLGQALDLKQQYCAKGTTVKFDLYPSEHIVTQFQAAPTATSWIADRFAGLAAPNTCAQAGPRPVSTANPGGGDFIVSLAAWRLAGSVYVNGLQQWLPLPSTSTMTAATNMTAGTLNGTISVPPFSADVNVGGLYVTVALNLTAYPFSGTASLGDDGQLHIHGTASATITISSLSLLVTIPAGCRTVYPVQFPLNFDGPVASLGNGHMTFAGPTTFPELVDCGLLGPALGLLFSGPYNLYTYTPVPPAPTTW